MEIVVAIWVLLTFIFTLASILQITREAMGKQGATAGGPFFGVVLIFVWMLIWAFSAIIPLVAAKLILKLFV